MPGLALRSVALREALDRGDYRQLYPNLSGREIRILRRDLQYRHSFTRHMPIALLVSGIGLAITKFATASGNYVGHGARQRHLFDDTDTWIFLISGLIAVAGLGVYLFDELHTLPKIDRLRREESGRTDRREKLENQLQIAEANESGQAAKVGVPLGNLVDLDAARRKLG